MSDNLNTIKSMLLSMKIEIETLHAKVDGVGERSSAALQTIMDCSKKVDMLINGSDCSSLDEPKKPSKTTTKSIKPASKSNNMMIFKEAYIKNQSNWDDILEYGDVSADKFKEDLFKKNKEILDSLSEKDRIIEECNLIFKNLNTIQKNKLTKYIKLNPKTEEVSKDDDSQVLEESKDISEEPNELDNKKEEKTEVKPSKTTSSNKKKKEEDVPKKRRVVKKRDANIEQDTNTEAPEEKKATKATKAPEEKKAPKAPEEKKATKATKATQKNNQDDKNTKEEPISDSEDDELVKKEKQVKTAPSKSKKVPTKIVNPKPIVLEESDQEANFSDSE
jgi:hypothetical protein